MLSLVGHLQSVQMTFLHILHSYNSLRLQGIVLLKLQVFKSWEFQQCLNSELVRNNFSHATIRAGNNHGDETNLFLIQYIPLLGQQFSPDFPRCWWPAITKGADTADLYFYGSEVSYYKTWLILGHEIFFC